MLNEEIRGKMITKISKGQQITIPAELRKKFNLKEGNIIEIEARGNEIIIRLIDDDLERLFEEAKRIKPKFHLTAKEIDELNEKWNS